MSAPGMMLPPRRWQLPFQSPLPSPPGPPPQLPPIRYPSLPPGPGGPGGPQPPPMSWLRLLALAVVSTALILVVLSALGLVQFQFWQPLLACERFVRRLLSPGGSNGPGPPIPPPMWLPPPHGRPQMMPLPPPGFVVGNSSATSTSSNIAATTATSTATTAHSSTATTVTAGGAEDSTEDSGLRLTSKLEEAAQEALFRIFRKPFVKARPSWLVNPLTKKHLEFDLWNESLRVAVEIDEVHHHVAVNKRHASEVDFEYQRYKDAVKNILAREHGVTLIRCPFTIAKKDVEEFLRERLRQARVPMPPISPAFL